MTDQQFPIEQVEDSNTSNNPHFNELLNSKINRRSVLRGGVGMTAAMMFGSVGLVGCGSDDDAVAATPTPAAPNALALPKELTFKPVAHHTLDKAVVAEGYEMSILTPVGTPLFSGLEEWDAAKTESVDPSGVTMAQRVGDNHDGLWFFGMKDRKHDVSVSDRGLIALNHEFTNSFALHTDFANVTDTTDAALWYKKQRQASHVRREINAHGVTIMEVMRKAGSNNFELVKNSSFNRRITAATVMDIAGPVKGSALVQTKFDPAGNTSRGTLNNCGSNPSPWGTYLTAEENFHAYFGRNESTLLTVDEDKALNRFGLVVGWTGWAGSGKGSVAAINWEQAKFNYLWFSPNHALQTNNDEFRRWDITASAASAKQDYRNEANTFGYIVEIEPFDASSKPVKRTAMGRYAHETATYAPVKVGEPVVFYMGDDSRGEYIYKFVSKAVWDAKDATGGLKAGDKYLNEGTIYAAKFNADGTGEWLELSLNNPKIKADPMFKSLAEVCVYTRLAADIAGATRMDRPEWTAVSPVNGEVYVALTNNNAARGGFGVGADAANPRVPNANGHVIRFAEKDSKHKGLSFAWDVYVFGSPNDKEATHNLSGLTKDNDFSSPDGIGFDPRGMLWIQTDDGAYTGTTNCMLLAALPGKVGDGAKVKVGEIDTPMGAKPTAKNLVRFFVGPVGCEITGLSWTDDMKSMFIAVQHPGGEDLQSRDQVKGFWPATQSDPVAKTMPRSALVVITRKDGGVIAG